MGSRTAAPPFAPIGGREMTAPNANEGERLKAEAHQLLEAHRAEVITAGRRAMLRRMLDTGRATADDTREAVELPPGIDPKAFGAVPGALARAGIIRRDGYAKTTRKVAHARNVAVWVLVDRAKALAWLAANPSRPTKGNPVEPKSFESSGNATPDAGTSGGRTTKGTNVWPRMVTRTVASWWIF
jgi:hypothetical protein